MPYDLGLELQERLAVERASDLRPDTLLLLEHPPTITLGRRATEADLLWSRGELRRRGIAVASVRRGGAATFHGGGQLVGYPIVRLAHRGRGVRAFVTALENVICDVCATLGVVADRRPGHPGIWVGDRKVASIGVEVRRGISRHGFALNVDMDLEPFSGIVPCSTPGLELTDLTRASGRRISVEAAVRAVLRAWAARFGSVEEEEANELLRAG